jgi:FkbM family methyltransferase
MLRRIVNKLSRGIYRPAIEVVGTKAPLRRLGTRYGGKSFLDVPSLQGATIISAGLGEDASFDIEFARAYAARVIIVDPTPRSIAYHGKLVAHSGKPATVEPSAAGCLPIESYDMRAVTPEQIPLCAKALWIDEQPQRFFMPPNPEHVSHSIVNFQNDYRDDTAFISVESTTLAALMSDYEIARLPLLKMDIEGAEVAVLEHMLSEAVPKPEQICVEFDELARPGPNTRRKYEALDARLRAAGYRCVFYDGYSDYSYARI